jgi:multidrug efflux pump subunit AcrA (membrane-fusion protein)
MRATALVSLGRLLHGIVIPTSALFQKGGRSIVHVLRDHSFEERWVEVGRQGVDRALILKGLNPGERIALKDPTILKKERP